MPSVTLLADKYWAMKNQTIKLNCSSNIRSFGLNAEFLLHGNTYNNVGLFNNRCFRTIDARACTPKICSCSVDGLSFMFMFDISKISKTDNNGLLFECQMTFRAEEFTKGLFASETLMIPVIGEYVHKNVRVSSLEMIRDLFVTSSHNFLIIPNLTNWLFNQLELITYC